MKTITYIIGILLIFCPFFLFAQIDKDPSQQTSPKNDKIVIATMPEGDPAAGYDGSGGFAVILAAGNTESIYFPDDWALGTAYLVDGSVIEGMRFRYNMYAQQMQFIQEGDTAAFARPQELASIIFDEYTFIYLPFQDEKETKNGYFELLSEGKCQLLLRREITYHLVDDLDDGVIDDSYILEQSYYLKREDKPANRILMNRKSVISAFCDRQETVKKYIKNNKIRFNNQEDMISVVNYYNSLTTNH